MNAAHMMAVLRVIAARCVRPVVITTVSGAVLVSLFCLRKGFTVDRVLELSVAVFGALPLIVNGSVVRSKSDGALRFLASLPIRGSDQAIAWLILCATLSVPLVICVSAMMMNASLPVGGLQLPLAFGCLWSLATVASFAVVAVQLSVPPGRAATAFVFALTGFVLVLQLVSGIQTHLGAQLIKSIAAGWLLPLLSAILYSAAVVVGTVAFRRVAFVSCTYVGDPVEA